MPLHTQIAWVTLACTFACTTPGADDPDTGGADPDPGTVPDTDTDSDTDADPTPPVALGGGADTTPSFVRLCATEDAVYALWADDRRDPGSGALDLWLDRSDDGVSWLGDPVRVSTRSSPLWDPVLACDGASVTVAWEAERDSVDGNHQIYVNRSDDGGFTWLDADVPVDADPDGRTMSIQPALAARGDAVFVAFADDRNGAYDVFAARSTDGGHSFRSPVRLDADLPGSAYSAEPVVGFGATDDDLFVAWSDTRDGTADVWFARSDNGGTTFRTDVRLDATDAPGASASYDPRVCASGQRIAVVWQDQRRDGDVYDVYVASSDDDGATWTSDARIDDGAASSERPSCVFDEDGRTAHVAWTEDGATPSVAAATVVDGARTGDVAVVTGDGADPQLAIAGGIVAVGWIGADGAYAALLGADPADPRALGGGGAPAELAFAVRDGVGFAAWAGVSGPLVGSAAL